MQEEKNIELIDDRPIKTSINVQTETIELTVRELFGYDDDNEQCWDNERGDNGRFVILGGKLLVNPDHQRGYVWKDTYKAKLIESLIVGRRIPVITFCRYIDNNGNLLPMDAMSDSVVFHCLDGLQRLTTIYGFLCGDFKVKMENLGEKSWENLNTDKLKRIRETILNYKLQIDILTGLREDIMEEWKVKNTTAMAHTNQEIRNGVHASAWVDCLREKYSTIRNNGHAKEQFSGLGCGDVNRQVQLETVLSWVAAGSETKRDAQNARIDDYMSTHNHLADCSQVSCQVDNIIKWWRDWTEGITGKEYAGIISLGRKIGVLYAKYHDKEIMSPAEVRNKVDELVLKMNSQDDLKKNNIMELVISNAIITETTITNISDSTGTDFSDEVKRKVYIMNEGKCAMDGEPVDWDDAEFHHLIPKSGMGRGVVENCILLHKRCHNHATGTKNLFDITTFPYAKNIKR